MAQGGSKNGRCSGLLAERRLRSGRLGATMRLDFPRVTVPRQRCQFLPQRVADQRL
jgi:hypothetical protein